MELRVYVKKKLAEERLRTFSIERGASQGERWTYWGPFTADDKDPELAYYTLTSLIEEPPVLASKLKVVKVILHAKLAAEQNEHIKQGVGKFGDSHWEIEFGAEKFAVPTSNTCGPSPDAFRAIISIWVHGTNLQSAIDCYKKIREGEIDGNWKGRPAAIEATANLDDQQY